MKVTYRSYLTAGVSVFGAGAIALSAVQPLPETSSLAPATSTAAVSLAASIDPITPWVDAIKLAVANTKTINEQKADPGPVAPIINAVANNFKVYLAEFPDFGLIAKQIAGNLKAAGQAVLDQNLNDADIPFSMNTNDVQVVTSTSIPLVCKVISCTKYGTTGLLASALVPAEFNALVPIANILSSPVSGAILGWAGPALSALAVSIDTVNNVLAAIKAQDWTAALNEVINLPANTFNAILNGGGHLDLTPIVKIVAPIVGLNLPEGTKIGLATGGFLTPATQMGGEVGTVQTPGFYGWGGTAWDAVSAEATVPNPLGEGTLDVTINGIPVGNAATQYGERYAIAQAIRLPMPKSAAARTASAAAVAADVAADVTPAVEDNAPIALSAAPAAAPKASRGVSKAKVSSGTHARASRSAK
jgi:hypothetical protein